MQELNQLRDILKRGEFEETGKDVDQLEKQLQQEIIKERFTRNSVVTEYLQFLAGEISRCKQQLSEQEDLDDRQRLKLFARKQACQDFLTHFESHRGKVEQNIKQHLDEAFRQS